MCCCYRDIFVPFLQLLFMLVCQLTAQICGPVWMQDGMDGTTEQCTQHNMAEWVTSAQCYQHMLPQSSQRLCTSKRNCILPKNITTSMTEFHDEIMIHFPPVLCLKSHFFMMVVVNPDFLGKRVIYSLVEIIWNSNRPTSRREDRPEQQIGEPPAVCSVRGTGWWRRSRLGGGTVSSLWCW